MLEGFVDDLDAPVNQLTILPDSERQQLLVGFNQTEVAYPDTALIHELFEAQVKANPKAIALVFEDDTLTYKQLNQRANQLAHYLIEGGVTPDTLVGLCVERSLEMVIGILGVLKAGGAYVPLDPHNPEARLTYQIEDADLNICLLYTSPSPRDLSTSRMPSSA